MYQTTVPQHRLCVLPNWWAVVGKDVKKEIANFAEHIKSVISLIVFNETTYSQINIFAFLRLKPMVIIGTYDADQRA